MMNKGIDVSHWQGNIDWNKVKKAGIEFAIIKAGGSDAGFYTDSKWEANYKGAKAAGIPIGAYYFVGKDCVTAAAGKADAERFLKILKGKQLEYPVYMDNEAQPASAKVGITEATIAFCETMESAGYFVGIYGSAVSGFKERMDDTKLTPYAHWVAQYASKCSYKGNYGIWQYSSKGSVDGISGNVDLDYGYVDYPAIIKSGGFNGYTKDAFDDNTPAPATSSQRDQIIAQARAWLGKKESDGSHREIIDVYNSHKPLARGYAVKYTDAWCAPFVSALAIKCDLTDIIPNECGCGQMVTLFQKLGEWVENDAYLPSPGDVIFYDWQDSGSGDNTGWPDHVGIVEARPSPSSKEIRAILSADALCRLMERTSVAMAYRSTIPAPSLLIRSLRERPWTSSPRKCWTANGETVPTAKTASLLPDMTILPCRPKSTLW